MSPASTPPAQPPMMSPDGKWVWDGQKWIPVARHESVFPHYNEAVAEAQTGPPLAETMVSPPVNPFAPAEPHGQPASPFSGPPAPSRFAGPPPPSWVAAPRVAPPPAVVSPVVQAPLSYTSDEYSVPPWQRWASGGSGRSRTMYIGAAFIAVMLGVILLIYFGLSELPFWRAGNDQGNTSVPAVTPTPQLDARSESAIAARYITSVIVPADNTIAPPYTNYAQACAGQLSLSCQNALGAMDDALKSALARFSLPPPACIAAQVAKFKADLVAMDAAIPTAQKGFADNNRAELQLGLNAFNAGVRPLENDRAFLKKSVAACDSQQLGP